MTHDKRAEKKAEATPTDINNRRGLIALSPLLVFIAIYLVGSLLAGDFYKVPITIAFMMASIYAVAVTGHFPLMRRVDLFSRGASSGNLMLMLWIFVLAGAFASSAKATGAIDATVNLALRLMPGSMLPAGLFLAACFISLSIGTSVGTIVALVPIAAGLAQQTALSVPLTTAIIVGGAFFGDNLSFISDTTIVATSSQGCQMQDKFRVNAFIAFPAAVAVLAWYVFVGLRVEAPQEVASVEFVRIIPYLAVLLMAVLGMNVLAVLTAGIVLTGIIGLALGSYDVYGWMGSMSDGIMGMSELIIVTMLAGGMLEVVRANGGIDYIINKVSARISGKRGGELAIAMLVSLTNVCTANNTVAIITVGGIAKSISERFGIDPRKSASLLDTFSCFTQGIIPYGAQMLIAAGLARLNPVEIMPYLYYPYTLGAVALASILLRYPRRYS